MRKKTKSGPHLIGKSLQNELMIIHLYWDTFNGGRLWPYLPCGRLWPYLPLWVGSQVTTLSCSHENKARQISLFVVACDPTYLWGRVASDYFLALPTPPLVAWPYLLSDRLWPYRQFVTLAMGFAWQVQQFWCLRDVVPWPYPCLLGRVASDRHWLCVAGVIFSMPPRSALWPYFLFVWQVQYFRVLREVLRGLTFFLCGRCNIFDASEKFLRGPGPWSLVTPPPFCVAGAIFSMPPRSSPWHCESLLVTLAPFCVAGANVWRQW